MKESLITAEIIAEACSSKKDLVAKAVARPYLPTKGD